MYAPCERPVITLRPTLSEIVPIIRPSIPYIAVFNSLPVYTTRLPFSTQNLGAESEPDSVRFSISDVSTLYTMLKALSSDSLTAYMLNGATRVLIA